MSKIIFYPENSMVSNIVSPPTPIKIPEWYKKMPQFDTSTTPNDKLIVQNGSTNYSAKACMPFLDSLTTGYEISLWADIQVRIVSGVTQINWAYDTKELEQVVFRSNDISNNGIPHYEGFDTTDFSWITRWGVKTPKGYSCIFTHPFNRFELPFITTTGIMDTDNWGIWGNQPFSLKSGWEGVIPAGTPIIQIIPFKRENWESEIDKTFTLTKWANIQNLKSRSKFRGYYKNNFWQKKNFK